MDESTSNNDNKFHSPLYDPQAFQRKLKSRQRVIQSFEAKANANRTLTEKIADFLTSRFGSITFLTINIVCFLFWIVVNSGLIEAIPPFDPFPFGLMTTILSIEAILLATIVLISQNRTAKIDDLRAEVNLQINIIAGQEITKVLELQQMLLKKQGIDVSDDAELQQMLEPTTPEEIEKSLEKEIT